LWETIDCRSCVKIGCQKAVINFNEAQLMKNFVAYVKFVPVIIFVYEGFVPVILTWEMPLGGPL
jgi:hypothetical protein